MEWVDFPTCAGFWWMGEPGGKATLCTVNFYGREFSVWDATGNHRIPTTSTCKFSGPIVVPTVPEVTTVKEDVEWRCHIELIDTGKDGNRFVVEYGKYGERTETFDTREQALEAIKRSLETVLLEL